MARTRLDETDGRTVADITHSGFKALPSSTTVAGVREWFASSESRHVALFADEGRYAGSLVRTDLAADADPARPAVELARPAPTVAPDEPAARAGELALASPALRVAVVDHKGQLVGIVAVTGDRQGFCGTG